MTGETRWCQELVGVFPIEPNFSLKYQMINLQLLWSEPQKLDTHLTKLEPTDETYFY